MNEKPWVKTYCGGKPNYCTFEKTPQVDAVDTSQESVDETAKGEHETLYMDMSQVPTGMPDWKPGMVFPTPKREWVGLTDDEIRAIGNGFENDNGHIPSWMSFARAIEAKIKEKNGG